ncbi:hypothetical protein NEOLI_005308 [Neolecta irregularis DAH-3]|uniref:Uncharacterized protein n=1 Tax=Neolecta irregularis (strain DAH-3) TaxID=1198029 RepID=A0A1U7LKJ4_NEOID|nr:hypothetical protein NEOLI_005308 [Neolecta irregularis DAH-3]|eukprot:OLL23174.1 hypothetical protein NEOLI_005308 [Neolecta irregularis DAH-3]
MLTPFILLLGIVAASPVLTPLRVTRENQNSQIPQRPQRTSLEVVPTAYLDYSSDDELIQMTQDPEVTPTVALAYFPRNNDAMWEDEEDTRAWAKEMELKKIRDWIANAPSWLDGFWSANLDDDVEFQKAKPVLASLWNAIQQFDLPSNYHLMDYDHNRNDCNLVQLVVGSLKVVGIRVFYYDVHVLLTKFVLVGRHFNGGNFDLDLLEHCFAYTMATRTVQPSMDSSSQSSYNSDDSDNSDDLAKFADEELDIVGKAMEDWQQSSNSNLSHPERLMSGIIKLWRMMASLNLDAEHNSPEEFSDEYYKLLRRFMHCGKQIGFTVNDNVADSFFKRYVDATNQMDSMDVNLEYFARFLFKELEYWRPFLESLKDHETDESSIESLEEHEKDESGM